MDLLRLVLARQPADKLWRMPNLMKPRFLETRAEIWGYQNTGDLILDSTRRGEVSTLSFTYVRLQFLKDRAVFLRHAGIFNVLCDVNAFEGDFWNELASGIPEIQARAIIPYFFLSSRDMSNEDRRWLGLGRISHDREPPSGRIEECNDPVSIPWTASLFKAIEPLLYSNGNLSDYVKGFFSIPNEGQWYYRFIGLCHQRLGGLESEEFSPVLDQEYQGLAKAYPGDARCLAIYGGYLHPVLRDLRRARTDPQFQSLIGAQLVRWPLISEIPPSRNGWSALRQTTVTWASISLKEIMVVDPSRILLTNLIGVYEFDVMPHWYRQRVERLLADEVSRNYISRELLLEYELILGIDRRSPGGNPDLNEIRKRVGIPVMQGGHMIELSPLTSIQGTEFYDPVPYARHEDDVVFGRDAYRKYGIMSRIAQARENEFDDLVRNVSNYSIVKDVNKLFNMSIPVDPNIFYRQPKIQKNYEKLVAYLKGQTGEFKFEY